MITAKTYQVYYTPGTIQSLFIRTIQRTNNVPARQWTNELMCQLDSGLFSTY